MTLADKLVEVGNNRPKLYNKGALDYSPQETVSGEAIAITDISPIEHNMMVKVSGVEDLSKVKVYEQGKNSFDKNNYEMITAYVSTSLMWEFSADSKSIRMLCKPNTTYTISGDNPNNTVFRVGYTTTEDLPYNNNNGIYKVPLYNCVRQSNFNPITISTGNDAKYLVIQLGSGQWDANIEKLQIEINSVATGYEPYIEPTVYDVSADGSIDDFNTVSRATTLYTDTSGAVVECTYYQDGRKVKEKLIEMILTLGGVINE